MNKNSLLTFSIGIIYLWFGILKFIPHHSPAESLAQDTIHVLTFGLISAEVSIKILAAWESIVGILLVLNLFKNVTIPFAILHIVLTFSPLFLFPERVFEGIPFSLTILGQYIAKNIVILSVLIFVYIEIWQNKRLKSESKNLA